MIANRWKILILISLALHGVMGVALSRVVSASLDSALADLALMQKLSADVQKLRRELNERCPQ